MSGIDRESGLAVWRQIEETLAEEIRSRRWEEGQKLPTEADLSRRFAVNRHTLRRAVSALVDRGLVRVEQGRGAFVRENVLEYLVGQRTRFTENVRRANRTGAGRLVSFKRLRASKEVATVLRLAVGTAVLQVETVGEVDGRPMSYGTNWFPAKRFPDFQEVYNATHSITRVMEHHGIPNYARAVTKVTARMPDVSEAELLGQPRNRPVLYVEAVNVDPDGVPVQFSHVRYAADRFQMVFETLADGAKYLEGL
ncbi:phosphonate metabolism transcriptional regulator PhnF [Thalassobaculum sp. OXR-137]|uniref:phosphonate metabolism transcriptional regulator PhnF n=1 Tax=Thalassobaculum sp. OXR-137 TaxID=3100173 RepID=UPI002AC93990|nr:phosphonate metabolism transcriptional regulator PhnF [Thalassobaculum sp. OXR-137]WPZ33392.1 phosphonate metabolism transcriptional regulator PhnF [Thalassobaculum sp. OXR-137]